MKKCFLLFIFVFFVINYTFPSNFNANEKMNDSKVNIVPKPLKLNVKDGEFIITPQTILFVEAKNNELKRNAEYFTDLLFKASGIKLKIRDYKENSIEKGDILFTTKNADKNLGAEGYSLEVNTNSVTLKANKPNGIFYGIQTIRQLLPAKIENSQNKEVKWAMPCVSIEDIPKFGWRGFMLDCSRHFFPKEFVKKCIDYLAMHKMNTFHWHLNDDQGWRIEIKKYPKLTEIGSLRVDREQITWRDRERQKEGEKPTYGGFYTQKEIKEIVDYAKARYINVVPEIEMPAHCLASLTAYPENGCTGGPYTVPPGTYWPNTDIYCAGNDKTFAFLENVLTEVLALFPSKYIHIGGDEAAKDEWKKCSKCQQRIKDEKLKDENELQSYFVKRIEKFIISKKRKLIGWDEILEGGLAPEATVMSWRGIEGGIEAAKQKHDVVMTPTSHCYFDYYNAPPSFEPEAIGGFLPLNKVYSFNPVPEALSADERKFILGAQANLWTEYVGTPEHAEYMMMPRLAAIAEVGWTPVENKNWDDFVKRMNSLYKHYDNLKINYAKSANVVSISPKIIPNEKKYIITLQNEVYEPTIYYTLDGKEPNSNSLLYTRPFELTKSGNIKAAAFKDGKALTKSNQLKIYTHKAFAKEVDFLKPPSKWYNQASLTDGLMGKSEHSGGLWLGFQFDDFEGTIDLQDSIAINKISTTFLQNTNAWIFLPTQIEYLISKDGKEFKTVSQFTFENNNNQKDISIKEFKGDLKDIKARYIKVKAKNIGVCPEWHKGKGDKAWIFIDEIVVD